MKVATFFFSIEVIGGGNEGARRNEPGVLLQRQYHNPGLCESLEDNLRVLMPLVRAHPHL